MRLVVPRRVTSGQATLPAIARPDAPSLVRSPAARIRGRVWTGPTGTRQDCKYVLDCAGSVFFINKGFLQWLRRLLGQYWRMMLLGFSGSDDT